MFIANAGPERSYVAPWLRVAGDSMIEKAAMGTLFRKMQERKPSATFYHDCFYCELIVGLPLPLPRIMAQRPANPVSVHSLTLQLATFGSTLWERSGYHLSARLLPRVSLFCHGCFPIKLYLVHLPLLVWLWTIPLPNGASLESDCLWIT